jgi:ectoine hydroxylase-related dioxygenase (phytanoyl-CoA dioxygenase family)
VATVATVAMASKQHQHTPIPPAYQVPVLQLPRNEAAQLSDAEFGFNLRAKLAELKINGCVILPQVIDPAVVKAMRGAYHVLLENVQARDPGPQIKPGPETGDPKTGRGRYVGPNRFTVTIPWVLPFAVPEVYENPKVLAFMEAYWGTDDFRITNYHSNCPMPGSEPQPWHRDTRAVSDIPGVVLPNCFGLGLKFALVNTCESNAVEVLPATHNLADPSLEGQYNELMTQEDGVTTHEAFATRRLHMNVGDCWLQDLRVLHRGTANTSGAPRPELVLNYTRNYWSVPANQISGLGSPGDPNYIPATLTRGDLEALFLSERGWKLLGHAAPSTPGGHGYGVVPRL